MSGTSHFVVAHVGLLPHLHLALHGPSPSHRASFVRFSGCSHRVLHTFVLGQGDAFDRMKWRGYEVSRAFTSSHFIACCGAYDDFYFASQRFILSNPAAHISLPTEVQEAQHGYAPSHMLLHMERCYEARHGAQSMRPPTAA